MELVFLITVIKGYYSLQRFLEHLNSGFKLVTHVLLIKQPIFGWKVSKFSFVNSLNKVLIKIQVNFC